MSVTALQTAATGLSAMNTSLDVIANNIANVNTPGFKASRANFQDLMYLEKQQPGVENANGDTRPIGLYVGLGVKVSGTQQNFEEGSPMSTGNKLDLMIEGQGFFKVHTQQSLGGGVAYTRAGNFTLNEDRELVMANDQGRRLEPPISIPDNATSVDIDSNGKVFVTVAGETTPAEVGQLEIANFVNPAGLKSEGENLWTETNASGQPISGEPGTDARGTILQGFLENSNVDPTLELIQLIRTQRAFEFNSNTIRAADDALRTIGQLHR